MRFLIGLLAGGLFYCATVFPAVVLLGLGGDVWGGVFMLYGCVCGSLGVLLALD